MKLIRRGELKNSSILVTSRSYASRSLRSKDQCQFDKHIEVTAGFVLQKEAIAPVERVKLCTPITENGTLYSSNK